MSTECVQIDRRSTTATIHLHAATRYKANPPSFDSASGPLNAVVTAATSELDRLFTILSPAGYRLFLADKQGSMVDYRGAPATSWLSNDFGPGAPIYDSNACLIALLAATSPDEIPIDRTAAVIWPLLVESTIAIEEQLFRDRFRDYWILAVAADADAAIAPLISFDRHQQIVGADRHARAQFGIGVEQLNAGLSLWSLFSRNKTLRNHMPYGNDIVCHLELATHDAKRCAILTAPPGSRRDPLHAENDAYNVRPRRGLLSAVSRQAGNTPVRGGLNAAALRRVLAYIDAHLAQALRLDSLAAEARVSVSHYARAFKQSLGTSPHQYLLQRRLQHAQQLLKESPMALADIAATVGFSDQSHFTRLFGRCFGTSPAAFRKFGR